VARIGSVSFGWVAMGLLVMVSAEVLALITWNMGIRDFLGPLWFVVGAAWHRVYAYVGPVIFPLALFTGLHLYVTLRLVQTYRKGCLDAPTRLYRTFSVIEVVAPAFGFLGTTLSLVEVMANIDPGLGQSEMLKTLLNNSASAFGSTVFGLVLSIAAYLTREVFENFLLGKKA